MEFAIAVLLGVVEGLTEFLPVSSTGHMILVGHFVNADSPQWHVFEVFIQLGAILAVVVLYWQRFLGLFDFSASGYQRNSFCGLAGMYKIAAGCIPSFVLGALFHSKIKELLFSPGPVIVALLVGALGMLWMERRAERLSAAVSNDVGELSLRQCLLIGMFQCLALWPGMSRSASTIVGAMFVGGSRSVAAEYSFLIAVPTMCAAVAYDLLKSAEILDAANLMTMAVGFIVSFVTAILAVKFFVSFLQRSTLRPFAYYRLLLGAVLGVVLLLQG